MLTPDQLLKASADGIRFPILSVRMHGGLRDYVHEYPHSPGGAPEILGRKLYEIEVVPCFDAAVSLVLPEYEGLWPGRLTELRKLFVSETRLDLVLPTIGKIRAYAYDWDQEFNAARSLTGEAVSWKFREDQENARLIESAIGSVKNLPSALSEFRLAGEQMNPKPNLWDKIAQSVSQVLAYRDQYHLYAALIESKLLSILSMIAQIDAASDELKNPRNSFAVQAMIELWAQTQAFYQDQKQVGLITRYYTTRVRMDVGRVATAIFGDSEKASELVALNAFDDPYDIPAGTSVRYYQVIL